MRFVGTVVYVKRQDHAGYDPNDDGTGPKTVTDLRLDGHVAGHPVWLELCVPTSQAKAYPVGRRVVLELRPR